MSSRASSTSSPVVPLEPTWTGFIPDTGNALAIVEAALRGHLNMIPRRPHDKERDEVIRSGNVFLYDLNTSGIKRWTDGRDWSPSRIQHNWLVYREIDRQSNGRNKKAAKKAETGEITTGGITKKAPSSARNNTQNIRGHGAGNREAAAGRVIELANGKKVPHEGEMGMQKLIGSLVGGYPFKKGGLIKRTMSFESEKLHLQLVTYMSMEDYASGLYSTPYQHAHIRDCFPRQELLQSNFRFFYMDDLGLFEPMYEPMRQQLAYHQALIANPPGAAVFHPHYGLVPHGMPPPGLVPHGMPPPPPPPLAPHNMPPFALAPHDTPPHGLAPNGMQARMQAGMHEQPPALDMVNYPMQDHSNPHSPDYRQDAYTLGSTGQQAQDIGGQEPRSSLVGHPALQTQAEDYGGVSDAPFGDNYGAGMAVEYHSPMYQPHQFPSMQYGSHAMDQNAYPGQEGTYPSRNGSYDGADGAYEARDMAYAEGDMAYPGQILVDYLENNNQHLPQTPDSNHLPPSST
ncbi:Gluconate transport-inducing protein required for gluconate-H+ symport [Podospora bellae-mahoneyi]|uniref:Gluconate transport-inducing protein required for gluconate-H+ symport n=1 Tax=Podospora bellae-mahoneyi TaxID=2093777 RepID=A0ABR0F8V4_9PEZI|nr:Gluconate transport-inducing protein required for gluconate-H+ symport [Podospora bellae-mahoneyi]